MPAADEHLVAGAQDAVKTERQRVRAGGDLRPHEGVFRLKDEGKELGKRIPANVVIAIAGGGREMAARHTVFLEGADDAARVDALDVFDARKRLFTVGLGLSDELRYGCGDLRDLNVRHGLTSMSIMIFSAISAAESPCAATQRTRASRRNHVSCRLA